MQPRTLQECGRLFKQQLQQQELISIQVLDQVQESLSLLRALYRRRMPVLSSEINGEHSSAEVHKVMPSESLQLTETEKEDNKLEKQQQSISQQRQRSTLQTTYQRREEQTQQLPSQEQSRVLQVPYRRDTGRLSPGKDIPLSEGKEARLQRPAVQRLSFHEHTLLTENQREEPFGHVQRYSVGHERPLHPEALERHIRAAPSSPTYVTSCVETHSARRDALHKATQLSTNTLLQSVAAVAGDATAASTARRLAARAGSASVSSNEPQPRAPCCIETTVTRDYSRGEVLPKHLSVARDALLVADPPNYASSGNNLLEPDPQHTSAFPSAQLLQSKALEYAEERMSLCSKTLGSVSPVAARQLGSRNPDHLRIKAPPPIAAPTSEYLTEQTCECKLRRNSVTCPCSNAAEGGSKFSSPPQTRTKQSKILYGGSSCLCFKAQGTAKWDGDLKRESGKSSAASTTGCAEGAHIKGKRECRAAHGAGPLPREQTATFTVREITAAADVSLHPSVSCAKSSVYVGQPSTLVAKNKAVDHEGYRDKAPTAVNAKQVSPAGAAKVTTGSRSDTEIDDALFAASGTRGDAAAHEAPCPEMRLEVTTSHIPSGAASLAHCRKHWSEDEVRHDESSFQGSSPRSLLSPLLTCARSTIDTNSEDTPGDFPERSLPPGQEEGRTESQLQEGQHRWQKPGGDRGGSCIHHGNVKPLRMTLVEHHTRTAVPAVQHCEDQQRQGSSKALPQAFSSPTQKSKTFHLQSQQGSARSCARHQICETQLLEPPCAYMFHCPYSGYALVTPGNAVGVVGGAGNSVSSPTSSATPESDCAAHSCAAAAAQESGVADGLGPRRSGVCQKKVVDTLCKPAPPASSPKRPAVSCPRRPLPASSVQPAAPVRLTLNSCAVEVLPTAPLSTACCDSPQQSAARRLGEARCGRPFCKRDSCSSVLCNGRCLVAVASSRSPGLLTELSPLLAREEESQRRVISSSEIRNGAATGSPRSLSCIADRKYCKPVASVTPVSCNCTASSHGTASRLPSVARTVRMTREPEGRVTSSETRCTSSTSAFSCPVVLDAPRDTTAMASSTSCLPLKCGQQQNPRRRGSVFSTGRGTPEAASCVLCCRPFHCSSSSEFVVEQLLHPHQTAHKSFSVLHGKDASTSWTPTGPSHPHTSTECTSCSKNELEEQRSPSQSGDHLCCGTETEVSQNEHQRPATPGALGCKYQSGNYKQLHSSSCAGHPSTSSRLPASVQPRVKLAVCGKGNQCGTPTNETPTNETGPVTTATTQEKVQLQNGLTTCSRCRPPIAAQPTWAIGFPAQRLPKTSASRANDGVGRLRSCETNAPNYRNGSTKSLKSPSDCVTFHHSTELLHCPRRHNGGFSKRAHRLCRIQPLKPNANHLSFNQWLQYPGFPQEKSDALLPQFHHPPDHYPLRGPKHQRDNSQASKELYRCNNAVNMHEDTQKRSSPDNKPASGPAFPCSLTCCTAAQEEAATQQFAPFVRANETSRTVDAMSSVTTGRAATKNAGNTSEHLSLRRLSTATTHAEDSASTEFSSQPDITVHHNEICPLRPQGGNIRRELLDGSPNAYIDGNSTPEHTPQQREGKVAGKQRQQQCMQAEFDDTIRQVADRPRQLSHAQAATQWRLAPLASHHCTPFQLRVLPHSSSACIRYSVDPHDVQGGQDEGLGAGMSNAFGPCEAAESPKGATQQEGTAEKCQWSYLGKQPQGKGDGRSSQNSLHQHQIRTQHRGSHAETQLHIAIKPVAQTLAPETHCRATGLEHCREVKFEQLVAVVHPECAVPPIADAAEPSAPPQPSSFIFKSAAAEAVAILRHED